jgi:hypothetical protein
MTVNKLIIFDYSGTLSLESTLFARPEYLMKQLTESGLMELGVSNPDVFWNEIVNPSWLEGSTTPVGYKKVIEDGIAVIFDKTRKNAVPCGEIADAASSFVDSYLSHSRIDQRWQHILYKLQNHPSVQVIIATDHYAEATAYIIRYLNEFQIHAVSAKDAFSSSESVGLVVANSADLGVHKADHRFWEILKTGLNIHDIREILLVDDFGYNEQKGDSYGTQEKVEQRKIDTEKLIRNIFSATVSVFPFTIESDERDKSFGGLIKQTNDIIERYLKSMNG